MAKNNYTRENIGVNDMLKRIIIRFDYSGVTTIDRWVEIYKETESCKKYFNNYKIQEINSAQISSKNLNDIETNGYIPITGYTRDILHVFSGKIPTHSEKIELQISSTSCSLDIHCNGDYKGASPYLDLISEYMTDFLRLDSYIQISRIGLRKIDAQTYNTKEEICNDFESDFFFGKSIRKKEKEQKEYKDNYVDEDNKLKTNMSRVYRQIIENGTKKHQVIFDADSYVDTEIDTELKHKYAEIHQILKSLNENLFEIFRDVVTEQFLNIHKK